MTEGEMRPSRSMRNASWSVWRATEVCDPNSTVYASRNNDRRSEMAKRLPIQALRDS